MGRFSKDNSTEEKRFWKQKSRCALCSKKIVFENFERGDRGAWEAHHIDGNSDNHMFTNCACVCRSCHKDIAHHGAYQSENVAPRSWFRLIGWKESERRRFRSYKPDDVVGFHYEKRDVLRQIFDDFIDLLNPR
jgi:hypothetical protein